MRSLRGLAVLALLAAATLSGCGDTVTGAAVSPLYDPFRAGGLPVLEGPSGVRDTAPAPIGTVENSDNGPADHLALLSINDIEEFWVDNFEAGLDGQFSPIKILVSYDSRDPESPRICGSETYEMANAMFCTPLNLMAWDRGVMIPLGQKFFGDMAVAALIAHEYGHAIQKMADLVDKDTSTLVAEQQADCFSGVYQRWVAEGSSPRFTLSTGDGLNHVLAAAITIRDPVLTEDYADVLELLGHGTALDRVSAFQLGFTDGIPACAAIDEDEVDQRRGNLPTMLRYNEDGESETGEVALDTAALDTVMTSLGMIFNPTNPPTLATEGGDCPVRPEFPVAYCPESNTVAADLAALQRLGSTADEIDDLVLVQGDNTAISALTSRYALAVQHDRGLPLDTPAAALRTACLTGVAQKEMADPAGEHPLRLTAGDIDEAVAGLLVNGIAASNVNNETVPAGFTRIVAFRSGLEGDAELCFNRFI